MNHTSDKQDRDKQLENLFEEMLKQMGKEHRVSDSVYGIDLLESTPRTITQKQFNHLIDISTMARHYWSKLKGLEMDAYNITGESDVNGYTSDLIWQSDVNVEEMLEELGIKVEESKHE